MDETREPRDHALQLNIPSWIFDANGAVDNSLPTIPGTSFECNDI